MLQLQNRNRFLLFVAAIIALMGLAAALPSMRFHPGDDFPFFGIPAFGIPVLGAGDQQGSGLVWFIMLFFWIGISFAIIYLLVSPEGRKWLLRMIPIFIVLLLFLQWLGNQKLQLRGQRQAVIGMGRLGLPEFTSPPTPEFVANPPAWLLLCVQVIIALIFLGTMLFLWRWSRTRQVDDSQAMIVREAERALADLEAGKDFKNSILRCYAEMSQVLQHEKHVKRRLGMTVREFETQLVSLGLDDYHIQRLTRLFEFVRYSPNIPGDREEREAVDCLHAIVRAYGEST